MKKFLEYFDLPIVQKIDNNRLKTNPTHVREQQHRVGCLDAHVAVRELQRQHLLLHHAAQGGGGLRAPLAQCALTHTTLVHQQHRARAQLQRRWFQTVGVVVFEGRIAPLPLHLFPLGHFSSDFSTYST